MKWARLLFALLGIIAGTLLVMWWINDRHLPVLRFSRSPERGCEVYTEWIQIK